MLNTLKMIQQVHKGFGFYELSTYKEVSLSQSEKEKKITLTQKVIVKQVLRSPFTVVPKRESLDLRAY